MRRGIVKTMLEEYLPLSILAANLPAAVSGRLLAQSNAGADAVLELNDPAFPSELRVQITVADQDHQEALVREKISQGAMVFRNTVKKRSGNDPAVIEEHGRVLTTPKARAQGRAAMIIAAFDRKVRKYRLGTDALLIHVSGVVHSTHDFSWSTHITQAIQQRSSNPYKWVFVSCSPSTLLTVVRP